MTTMQGSGVVDMSGVISSILQRYQQVLTGYQQMVTGDPSAVTNAAAVLQDEAGALSSVSGDLSQRASTLAGSWQGSAYDAFRTATTGLTGSVDDAANSLLQEAQKLTRAATLLGNAKSEVDSVAARFQQAAQQLINESRTAAAGMANGFIDVAYQLGESANSAARKVVDDVTQQLAKLWNVEVPLGDTGKTEYELAKKTWSKLDGSGDRTKAVPWKWQSKDYGTKPPEQPESDSKLSTIAKATSITLAKGGSTLYQSKDPLAEGKAHTSADLGAWGTAKGDADYDVGLTVKDSGSVSIKDGQLQASGDIKATVVDASASANYSDGPLAAHAKADAMVGADLSGKLSGGITGPIIGGQAHVGAFAGAEVKGDVGADVAGVGLGASGSLQAGIGVQADGQLAYDSDTGHFYANAKLGAALGVGASGSVSMDVDVPKVVNDVEEYGSSVWHGVENAAGAVEYAAGQAATAIGNAYVNAGPYAGMW
jgi:WXG100 family type VII secretion target